MLTSITINDFQSDFRHDKGGVVCAYSIVQEVYNFLFVNNLSVVYFIKKISTREAGSKELEQELVPHLSSL